jgi:site-specific DNA recombinase
VDESKSGSKVEGRDQFQRLMRDAAKGEFDIVVYDTTRFGRNGADIINSARTLAREFGVHVVDTKGRFDTRERGRVLTNYVEAGVAEDERLRIMERMLGARVAKAKAGLKWSGSARSGGVSSRKPSVGR